MKTALEDSGCVRVNVIRDLRRSVNNVVWLHQNASGLARATTAFRAADLIALVRTEHQIAVDVAKQNAAIHNAGLPGAPRLVTDPDTIVEMARDELDSIERQEMELRRAACDVAMEELTSLDFFKVVITVSQIRQGRITTTSQIPEDEMAILVQSRLVSIEEDRVTLTPKGEQADEIDSKLRSYTEASG